MVDASGTELAARSIGGGEAEVGNRDSKTIVKAHHVLGLQVAMVDSVIVTVLNAVDELQEHFANDGVLAKIPTLVKDLMEEVV